MTSFFLGARVHLFPDAAQTWDPYVGLDLGGGIASSVDVTAPPAVPPGQQVIPPPVRTKYWKESAVFVADVLLGLEYRFEGTPISVFAEAGIRLVSGSKAESLFGSDFNGETSTGFPLAVGVAFRF